MLNLNNKSSQLSRTNLNTVVDSVWVLDGQIHIVQWPNKYTASAGDAPVGGYRGCEIIF